MNFQDINKMTFESASEELEKIASKLEESEVPLEDAVLLFERGAKLKKFCDEQLKNAKLKVQKIIEENNKIVGTEASILQSEYDE